MKIEFTRNAWEDYEYWVETNPEIIDKIKSLIHSIIRNPFQGSGKPEPLKHGLKGFWSRRITQELWLVYKVSGKKGIDQKCTIIQCRFHYEK